MGSFFLVFLCIVYYIWFFFFNSPDKEVVQPPVGEVSQAVSQNTGQADNQVAVAHSDTQVSKDVVSYADSVGLPYSATAIYLSGVQAVYSENRFLMHRQYFFDLVVGAKTYSVDGEQLTSLGFKLEYQSDCLVYLRSSKNVIPAICPPKESLEYEPENKTQQSSISLL